MLQGLAWLLRSCLDIEVLPGTFMQCDHNHIRRERHAGRWWFVHRKGAAPAFAGRAGLIPGSMGTPSYHVTGRGCAARCAPARTARAGP